MHSPNPLFSRTVMNPVALAGPRSGRLPTNMGTRCASEACRRPDQHDTDPDGGARCLLFGRAGCLWALVAGPVSGEPGISGGAAARVLGFPSAGGGEA